MLFLVFQVGLDRYALEAGQVVEVLPWLALKELPHALPGVAGLFNYHGELVPVIDLNEMARGERCGARLSSRIVLVRYPPRVRRQHLLGLLVEKANATMMLDPGAFVSAGVRSDGAPYLGPVCATPSGVIQRVEAEALLTEAVRDALFCDEPEDSVPV